MSLQIVNLIYADAPSINREKLTSRVNELCHSGAEIPEGEEISNLMLVHAEKKFEVKDGFLAPMTVILESEDVFDPDDFQEEIQQSWGCENLEQLLENAKVKLMVTELYAITLEPKERLELFHASLQALVEQTNPKAIVFNHSKQIMDPAVYLESCENPLEGRAGIMNVRFYNISDSDDNAMLMDTKGLENIGLHELQCHFKDLDPSDVAGVLFSLGLFILSEDVTIESRDTVEGIEPGSEWAVQFEASMVDPESTLLDLNPGPPHAAGHREEQEA